MSSQQIVFAPFDSESPFYIVSDFFSISLKASEHKGHNKALIKHLAAVALEKQLVQKSK